MADTDPLYLSGKVLEMLESARFPDATPIHDFDEAMQARKRSVILVDLRIKCMEPYGDRTEKSIDIDLYFFDSSMNPVSRMNGHAEYKVPYASMEVGMRPDDHPGDRRARRQDGPPGAVRTRGRLTRRRRLRRALKCTRQ